MDARAILSQLAAGGLIIFAAACELPTAPGRLQPPQATLSGMTTFTVTNGWTGEAVAGALVSANGTQAVTDSAGQVQLLRTVGCLKVEVTVSGFLERRTCSASPITLWPVANEEEREATRTMAFGGGQRLRGIFSSSTLIEVGLMQDLRNRPEVVQIWTSAADEIKRLTSNRISIRFVDPFPADYPDGALMIAPASAPPDCDARFVLWPVETAGFCGQRSPEHWFITIFNVLPDRLTDRSVALRALLTGALQMQPHAMPGLINGNRPDRELSAFERKTLHMIGLRYRQVMWPDLEP